MRVLRACGMRVLHLHPRLARLLPRAPPTTEALLDCSGEVAARCPHAAHVAVCSGHDVPVAAVPPGALKPGVSLLTDFRCCVLPAAGWPRAAP